MKKLLVITAIAASLASPSFAKTEGHYVGADLINTHGKYKTDNIDSSLNNDYSIKDEDRYSLGANYKYALNYNNFFIAPGVFFDYSDVTMKDSSNDDWNLRYRYGAKADFGYDLTDNFALFANIGLANNNYKVDWKSVNRKNSGNDMALIYGIGAKYSITEHVDLNLAYEMSRIEMEDPFKDETEFDLRVIKIGASYKF